MFVMYSTISCIKNVMLFDIKNAHKINVIFCIETFAMDTEVILYPSLVIQEEMIDKGHFLSTSELNGCSLHVIDPSHKLL